MGKRCWSKIFSGISVYGFGKENYACKLYGSIIVFFLKKKKRRKRKKNGVKLHDDMSKSSSITIILPNL